MSACFRQKWCQCDIQYDVLIMWRCIGAASSILQQRLQLGLCNSSEQEENDMALCMHGKQCVGEKHGTNITQSGYLQVVSVGVIGSSAECGGGRI